MGVKDVFHLGVDILIFCVIMTVTKLVVMVIWVVGKNIMVVVMVMEVLGLGGYYAGCNVGDCCEVDSGGGGYNAGGDDISCENGWANDRDMIVVIVIL